MATRLEEFADRVTREILRAYWTEPCDDLTLAATNARIVLAREVREFVTGAVDWQAERSAMDPIDEPRAADWLDHTIAAPTPEQREAPDIVAPKASMSRPPEKDTGNYAPVVDFTPAERAEPSEHASGQSRRPAFSVPAQPTATKPCPDCGGERFLLIREPDGQHERNKRVPCPCSPDWRVTQECGDCGAKAGPEWTSWQCCRYPFGSCDGEMRSLASPSDREAAGRLREEMARTCIASDRLDGCCSALKRVNGGSLVTSGADPGPKGEAWRMCTCVGSCRGPEGLGPGWRCALRTNDDGRPRAPAASPATGMEPVPRGHCGRCDRCGWPMGGDKGQCRPLDCSFRPLPAERDSCAGCGAPFEPRPAAQPTATKPCPDCGGGGRRVDKFGRWDDGTVMVVDNACPTYQGTNSPPSPLARLLSLEAVREYLPVSRRKLYQLAKSGELPTCRIGRRVLVSVDEVASFIAARTNGRGTGGPS